MQYNRREIMNTAWKYSRKYNLNFAEALHRSWLSTKAVPINGRIVEEAKAAAGIIEETNTWYRWKQLGYEVIHESKALFGCDLIYGAKGDGAVYKARFFGRSQVREDVAC